MSIQNIPTRPARDDADPATGRHPRTSAVRATVVHGWDVRPTLDRASATGRSLAQAAGSLVAGSPLPQALIQCRQRLTDELRLGTLVILSWSAPQPVADDSAVAQPTTASSPGSSAPRTDRGHAATPHPAPDVTSRKSLRAEQRGCMRSPPRTWLARPSGAVILLITGAISLLGYTHCPGCRFELAIQGRQRQAEPDRQLQVSSVVGRKVMSTRQMHGISPGMGHRLVIDGNGKSTKHQGSLGTVPSRPT